MATPTPDPDHVVLDLAPLAQPDDVSCGPTCLAQVLAHHGDARAYADITPLVERNEDGGTLGVYLGLAALALGYRATLLSCNLQIFDPTWAPLAPDALRDKLLARAAVSRDPRAAHVARAYARFIASGGEARLVDFTDDVLRGPLERGLPIIGGLSATYLYGTAREDPWTNEPDDVGGEPTGHFVVIVGFREGGASFVVSDPYDKNPFAQRLRYEVPAQRLLHALLLGDVTYDGVLLVVEPPESPRS